MSSPSTAAAKQEQDILSGYEDATTLLSIEKSWDVPRATIYWVLEKHDVAPNRARRRDRLRGDDNQLALMYDLIGSQQNNISTSEAVDSDNFHGPDRSE